MSATQSIARFMAMRLEERLSREHLRHAWQQLLDLFRRTVREVPAYREFLTTRQFDPASVRTYGDFARLPLLTLLWLPSAPKNSGAGQGISRSANWMRSTSSHDRDGISAH
jgi:hypothetical protein